MKETRGFSLLELVIVVAIILIIATIAVPTLLRSRQTANEASAVSHLRLLNTAQVTFSSSHQGQYGSIPDLIAAALVDSRFGTPLAGYVMVLTMSGNNLDYTATATARGPNDGRFDYYTKPDYVIRYSTDVLRAPVGLTGEPVR